MAVILTNRSRYLLVVPLNSGPSLHLGPGEVSAPVERKEIEGNEKATKLVKQGQLSVMEKT